MKEMFQEITDDTFGDTVLYRFFNMAKTRVESQRPYQQLLAYDASQSISSGHTYLTQYTLPTRFLAPGIIYLGDDRVPHKQISMMERERFRDAAFRFYLDMKEGKFGICGAPNAGRTIKHYHFASTQDISATVDWTFPAWAHPIIPISAAKLFYFADRISKGRSMAPEWALMEKEIDAELQLWDNRLVKEARKAGQYPFLPKTHPNIAY